MPPRSVLPDKGFSSFKDPLSSSFPNRTLYTDILQLRLDVPWPLQAIRAKFTVSGSNVPAASQSIFIRLVVKRNRSV